MLNNSSRLFLSDCFRTVGSMILFFALVKPIVGEVSPEWSTQSIHSFIQARSYSGDPNHRPELQQNRLTDRHQQYSTQKRCSYTLEFVQCTHDGHLIFLASYPQSLWMDLIAGRMWFSQWTHLYCRLVQARSRLVQ